MSLVLDENIDQNFDPDNPESTDISQFGLVRGIQDLGVGGDLLLAPFRGVAEAGSEVWDLLDWLTGDDFLPDAPDALGLGRSKTMAGGLLEGVTQFATMFIPSYAGIGLAAKGFKGAKIAGRVSQATARKRQVLEVAEGFAKGTAAGAITDFTAFDPFEERLADFLLKFPALESPILEWLSATGNEEEGELGNRIRTMFEGAAIGAVFEPFIWALRALKGIRKGKATGADPEVTIEEVKERYLDDVEGGRAEGKADDLAVDLDEQINGGEASANEVLDATEPTQGTARLQDGREIGGEGDPRAIGGEGDARQIGGEGEARTERGGGELPPDDTGRTADADDVSPEGVPEGWDEVPTPDPARGDTPAGKPKALFNWENWVKTHAKTIKTIIRAEDPETLAELQKLEGLSHQEIKAKVHENNAMMRDLGIDPLSEEQIAQLEMSDQLSEAAAKQMRLRGMVGDYSDVVAELADEGGGTRGTLNHMVRFDLARKNSENLLKITKRNQEKIGQLLSAQRETPPSVLEKGDILNTLRASEDDEFVTEYVTRLGGGNIDLGRRMLESNIRRYQNAVKLGNKVSGVKWLADNPTGTQRFIEYWMNGILSGPVTHAINATSNALNTFFLIGEKVAGGALKFDTHEMQQGIAMFSYLYKQNTEALKAAGVAFKTEQDILDPLYRTIEFGATGKPGESKRALRFDNPVGNYIGKIINAPSLFLLTSDVYFRTLNYRAMAYASLTEKAFQKFGNSAGNGAWVEKQFQKIIADGQFYSNQTVSQKAYTHAVDVADSKPDLAPAQREQLIREEVRKYKTDAATKFDPELGALADHSIQYARQATWTQSLNDPERHTLVKFFGTFQKIANDFPLFRLIVPFVRTPTNLVAHLLDRTVGAWAELGKIGYSNIRLLTEQNEAVIKTLKAGGTAADDLHGRLASGATFMSMGYIAYANGFLVGGGPSDPEVARVWRAAGNIPYSFKIGDKRIEFRRFDPWAPMFGMMADIGELMSRPEMSEEDRSIVEGVASAMTIAVANSLGSRSVLTGLARVSNVFSDPERYAQSWLEQSATTLLPFSGLAGQIMKPEMEKEIRSVLDAIRVKYGMTGKGWSQQFGEEVQNKFTALGEPIDTKKISPFQPALNYRSTENIENKDIYEEMTRLKGGEGHGFQDYGSKRNGLKLAAYKNDENVSAETRANELMGTIQVQGQTLANAMRTIINSPEYQRINDDDYATGQSPKVDMLRYVHRLYKAEVWEHLLREFPELREASFNIDRVQELSAQGIDIPEELLASISLA